MALEYDNAAVTGKSGRWWQYLLKYGVPLVISVGLCYLLFAKQDFGSMVETIKNDCNYWWIVLALVISVFSHVFRAMRWRIQLRALNVDAPLYVLVLSVFGTYAVNLVFPRLGEIWRTGYVSQRQGASFTTVFGSMVADRLADTVTVLLLTLFTFVFAGNEMLRYLQQNEATYERLLALATSPLLWCLLLLVVVAVWTLFVKFPQNGFVVKVKGLCRGLWEGFAVIATMPGKGRWLVYTVCIWGCYFLQLYVAFFSFTHTSEVVARYGVSAVMVCFVLSSISMGVPSNGGIGPWQWAIMFGLSFYASEIAGLTSNYASSFANLVMGSQTLLLILLGLITFAAIAVDKRRKQPVEKI